MAEQTRIIGVDLLRDIVKKSFERYQAVKVEYGEGVLLMHMVKTGFDS